MVDSSFEPASPNVTLLRESGKKKKIDGSAVHKAGKTKEWSLEVLIDVNF